MHASTLEPVSERGGVGLVGFCSEADDAVLVQIDDERRDARDQDVPVNEKYV